MESTSQEKSIETKDEEPKKMEEEKPKSPSPNSVKETKPQEIVPNSITSSDLEIYLKNYDSNQIYYTMS